MKTYIYPKNLQRSVVKLLWSLPALIMIALLLVVSVMLAAFLGFGGGFIVTGVFAVLTIRPAAGELTTLEYLRIACAYFFGQQFFIVEDDD